MPTMFAAFQGQAVGANFQSLSPGFLIRGLSIDNPSGSWLFISSSNTYVPPYTLGYRATMKPAALQVSIEYAASGPGGQTSTLLGSPASINLYSQPVVDAPGNAFLNPDGTALGTAIIVAQATYRQAAQPAMGTNVLAYFNLNTAQKILSVIVNNTTAAACVISIWRLTNDTVSFGVDDTPVPNDPANPAWNGSVRFGPRIRSSSTGFTTPINATHTIVLPTNIVSGDLIVVSFRHNGNAVVNTPPAGYTLVTTNSTVSGSLSVWRKVSVGTEGGTTVTLVWNVANFGCAGCSVLASPHTTLGLQFLNATTAGGVVTINYNSPTPTQSPHWILCLAGWTGNVSGNIAANKLLIARANNANGGIQMAYFWDTTTGAPVAPGADSTSAAHNGCTTTALVVNAGLLTPTVGDNLTTLASVPAGGTQTFDISGLGLVGRLGGGFVFQSSAPNSQPGVSLEVTTGSVT